MVVGRVSFSVLVLRGQMGVQKLTRWVFMSEGLATQVAQMFQSEVSSNFPIFEV